MSDFAPEVPKYPKSSPKPKIAKNSVRAYYLALLEMQLVPFNLNSDLHISISIHTQQVTKVAKLIQ